MSVEMSREGVAKSYDRLAPVYDWLFGPVFRKGRAEAIQAAERAAGKGGYILEIGVGTGISLPFYSRETRLVGADISEDMLKVARKRVETLGLTNVESIEVGDAENLRFDDASFDVVVAQFVVSAVPNPQKALDEFARVVKPGGEIVIATRQGAERGLRKSVEKTLMPVTTKLGWRTDFPFALFTDWAAERPDIRLVERKPLPPLGHFALLRFEKLESGSKAIAA